MKENKIFNLAPPSLPPSLSVHSTLQLLTLLVHLYWTEEKRQVQDYSLLPPSQTPQSILCVCACGSHVVAVCHALCVWLLLERKRTATCPMVECFRLVELVCAAAKQRVAAWGHFVIKTNLQWVLGGSTWWESVWRMTINHQQCWLFFRSRQRFTVAQVGRKRLETQLCTALNTAAVLIQSPKTAATFNSKFIVCAPQTGFLFFNYSVWISISSWASYPPFHCGRQTVRYCDITGPTCLVRNCVVFSVLQPKHKLDVDTFLFLLFFFLDWFLHFLFWN